MDTITANPASSQENLQKFVERMEVIEQARRDLSEESKDLNREIRGSGFNPTILRQIIKMKRMGQAQINEIDDVTAIYRDVLGV